MRSKWISAVGAISVTGRAIGRFFGVLLARRVVIRPDRHRVARERRPIWPMRRLAPAHRSRAEIAREQPRYGLGFPFASADYHRRLGGRGAGTPAGHHSYDRRPHPQHDNM
jgi:hypothetical protein